MMRKPLGISISIRHSLSGRKPSQLSLPPNLLTANQASLETAVTGWVSDGGCSVARTTLEAADGIASLRITASGGSAIPETTKGTGGRPVTPSTVYVARAEIRSAAVSRQFRIGIDWFTAAGALITSTPGTNGSSSTSDWTARSVSGTSPSNAAFAAIYVAIDSCAASEIHYLDKAGLYLGTDPTYR